MGARIRSVKLLALLVYPVILMILFLCIRIALADYYPGDNTPGYYTVGAGGAKVQNQGSLDPTDAVNAWNTWTSTTKLSVGTTGCGTSTSCFIFVDEGQTLNGTYCTVPYLGDGIYAVAYQIIYGGNNIGDSDCNSIAQSSYPVFVIALNNSSINQLSPTPQAVAKLHIQRHEVGHGVGLPDAPTEYCYSEWGYYKPLMNNGTQSGYCSVYHANYTATYNEALYAVIRSGW
jgi:hypothetical protein